MTGASGVRRRRSSWQTPTATRPPNPTRPGRRSGSRTPLRTTPPSTESPPGHACFTSANVTALRQFFGRDDLSFSAYSADSDTTRHYDSLSEAMAELVQARIWAGLHFRTPPEDGQTLGAAVARDVLDHEFGRTRSNG